MSKVTLEFSANEGEVFFTLSGDQERIGMVVPCRWEKLGGDESSYESFVDFVVSTQNNSPQEVMAKMEEYAKKESLTGYKIGYEVEDG